MNEMIVYSLTLFFWFYLLNYAELTARPARWLKGLLGPQLGYPLSCALCWAFWITLGLWYLTVVPFYYIMAAPPIHLFIDLAYDRLTPPPVTLQPFPLS